jgi:aspartate aminotransferase
MTGYQNVDDFVEALLVDAKVAVIPGSGFGTPDNIRLSYATSLELLEKAVERIHQFVTSKSSIVNN